MVKGTSRRGRALPKSKTETPSSIYRRRIEMCQSQIDTHVRGFRGPSCEDSANQPLRRVGNGKSSKPQIKAKNALRLKE